MFKQINNGEIKMKEYKVNKKDFEKIFTNRKLTWRENFTQDIWFVEVEECWHIIEQRASNAGVAFAIVGGVIFSPVVFVMEGVKGLRLFWSELLSFVSGEPVRSDDCHTGVSSTNELIKLAGWD